MLRKDQRKNVANSIFVHTHRPTTFEQPRVGKFRSPTLGAPQLTHTPRARRTLFAARRPSNNVHTPIIPRIDALTINLSALYLMLLESRRRKKKEDRRLGMIFFFSINTSSLKARNKCNVSKRESSSKHYYAHSINVYTKKEGRGNMTTKHIREQRKYHTGLQ